MGQRPENFAEIAHLPNAELMPMLGVSKKTLARWRAIVGKRKLNGGDGNAREVPHGFAAAAMTMSDVQLGRRFRADPTTCFRWRKRLGLPGWREIRPKPCGQTANAIEARRIPAPADLAEQAADKGVSALALYYGRDRKVVSRWLREEGIEPLERSLAISQGMLKGAERRPRSPSFRRPRDFTGQTVARRNVSPTPFASRQTALLAGREEEAAQHLRRFFPFVFRCREKGCADHKGKFWRVGNAVLTPDELLDRAERKGWNPDAWRELAA